MGVEGRVVGTGAARRQFHQGDADLVFEPGIHNALPRVDEVIDVVERVEIADGRDAVLFEELGVELDDVARLRFEADHVDSPRQGLEFGVWAGRCAKGVHRGKGVFATVEVERLETSAAAGLKVVDASFLGRGDGRQKIGRENARAINRLEAVAEGGTHKANFLLAHSCILVVYPTSTDHKTPAPTAEPMTPAMLGAIACIRR